MSIFSFPVLPSKTDVLEFFCAVWFFLVLMLNKIMSLIAPVLHTGWWVYNIQNIEKTFKSSEISPDPQITYGKA